MGGDWLFPINTLSNLIVHQVICNCIYVTVYVIEEKYLGVVREEKKK